MFMGRGARSAAVLLVCAAMAVPQVAAAQEDDKARAKRLLASGSAKYEAGDYDGALNDFLQAYSAVHNPKIQFNIGQAYRHLAKREPVAEANAFSTFLEGTANDTTINSKQIEEARAVLGKLRATEVQQITVDINRR